MGKKFRNGQRGALLLEVLLATVILAIGGAIIIAFVMQHSKILRNTRTKDTANYTASFAARQYRFNYCSTGVVAGEGTVTVSDAGIGIYKLPTPAPTTSADQTYRFVATPAYTPTGDAALSFVLIDGDGKTISGKIIPANPF